MKHMMFVYATNTPALELCEQIAQLDGVEMVYEFTGPATGWERPDFVLIVDLGEVKNNGFYAGIEALLPDVCIRPEVITTHKQPHIITPTDIPGGPVMAPAKLRVASPVITSADIPGPLPTGMRTAVVHRDFSSQAGLAGFSSIGIGGVNQLVELHH